MSGPVRIEGLKWPATLHRQLTATRLGDNADGTWLWAPRGSPTLDVVLGPGALECDFLILVPPDAWWAATWMFGWKDIDLYVDLCTPVDWPDPGRLRLVDLDLDVVRRVDGTVELWDEDEFAAHSRQLAYPSHVVERCETDARELLRRVREYDSPFGSAPERWLSRARSLR